MRRLREKIKLMSLLPGNQIQLSEIFMSRVPEYIGYVLVCATAVQSVCMHMNMHRHKAPCAYLQLPAVASSLCLRLWRSWGLTFHFSDPLFHRANGSEALEKGFVTGGGTQRETKKILQNNSLLLQGCTSSLHPIHVNDITMILNQNQRTVLLRRCDSLLKTSIWKYPIIASFFCLFESGEITCGCHEWLQIEWVIQN